MINSSVAHSAPVSDHVQDYAQGGRLPQGACCPPVEVVAHKAAAQQLSASLLYYQQPLRALSWCAPDQVQDHGGRGVTPGQAKGAGCAQQTHVACANDMSVP